MRSTPPEYKQLEAAALVWLVGLGAIGAGLLGFWLGYAYPRDVEIESTAPVQFHYEVTPEAARLLVLKGAEGCRND